MYVNNDKQIIKINKYLGWMRTNEVISIFTDNNFSVNIDHILIENMLINGLSIVLINTVFGMIVYIFIFTLWNSLFV